MMNEYHHARRSTIARDANADEAGHPLRGGHFYRGGNYLAWSRDRTPGLERELEARAAYAAARIDRLHRWRRVAAIQPRRVVAVRPRCAAPTPVVALAVTSSSSSSASSAFGGGGTSGGSGGDDPDDGDPPTQESVIGASYDATNVPALAAAEVLR